MVIIHFVRKGVKYTWFIEDEFVMVVCFVLTVVTGLVVKKIRKIQKSRRIKNSKRIKNSLESRGGKFIDQCIDPDAVYEVVDPGLEIVVKQMLKLPMNSGPLIISVPLLVLAYIVSRQPVKQVSILGVTFVVERAKSLVAKMVLSVGCGATVFITPPGILALTGFLMAGALAYNVSQDIMKFDCGALVSKVPMERVSREKTIGFLERPPEKNSRVFIKGNENIEIYSPSINTNEYCSSKYEPKLEGSTALTLKVETQNHIQRTCEKKFVPLRERTKTLSDLKKYDSTENREKAERYIERYEDRRQKIMKDRELR